MANAAGLVVARSKKYNATRVFFMRLSSSAGVSDVTMTANGQGKRLAESQSA